MKLLTLSILNLLLLVDLSSQVIDLGDVQSSFTSEARTELKKQFSDSRIIVLGEQTHGIAEEYMSFAQMVKFLHEEMGFNVIVQEYCFYSSHLINQQVLETRSSQEFRKAMYWPQGRAVEYDALFDYLDLQKEAGNPLQVEGFDSRIANKKEVKKWIRNLVLSHPTYYSNSQKPTQLLSVIDRVIELEYNDSISSDAEQKEVIEFLNFIVNYQSSINKNGREVQQLKSLQGFVLNAWNPKKYPEKDIRRYHYRENQMADNLMWLIDSVYSNEKVIVHMHNGHAAKNIHMFQQYTNDPTGLKNITVGAILNEKYGGNCQIIGTTAFKGNHCKWDFKPIAIPNPHEKSLEAELHNQGFQYALVSLAKHKEPFYMFFNEFNNWKPSREIEAPYSKMFDAVLFFNQVKAPTRIETF